VLSRSRAAVQAPAGFLSGICCQFDRLDNRGIIILELLTRVENGHMRIRSAGKGHIRSRGSSSSRALCYASGYSVGIMESVAMDENGADTPEQVLKFVPKERPRSYAPLVEEAGEAIIAKIQKAADLSNENCDRAMKLAHKLSMQLRAAEDQINRLEAEVELLRDRAVRAERWLQTIQTEIEEKLIAPRSANATEQTSLPKDAEL